MSLDQSIQNFYTRQGYNDVFLPASQDISNSLADDTWVLGDYSTGAGQDFSPEQLKASVTEQYYTDYIAHWEALFSNLTMRGIDGLQQASEFIALISDADSPLKEFLTYASEQTTLTSPPATDPTEGAAETTNRETILGTIFNTQQESITEPVEIDPVTRSLFRATCAGRGFRKQHVNA